MKKINLIQIWYIIPLKPQVNPKILTLATCSSIQYLKWETLEYTIGKPSAPHIDKPQEKIPESCHSLFFQHIICLAESAWKTYQFWLFSQYYSKYVNRRYLQIAQVLAKPDDRIIIVLAWLRAEKKFSTKTCSCPFAQYFGMISQ